MIISGSNIETAQKCERMYYYAVVLKLSPRELPIFLKRGSFGHEMMEYGFRAIMEGGTVEEATQAAAIPLERMLASDDPDKAEMMKVYRHVITFISWTQSPEVAWKPVAIEDVLMWDLTLKRPTSKEEITLAEQFDNLVYAFTPDLIIEFTRGPYKGQHAILDYKFLGQYMTAEALDMSQQILKYIIYRNKIKTDFKIRRGAFVQLNTRADATATGHKLFLVKWQEPTKHRLERIEYENEQLVERTANLHGKRPDEFLRTTNKNVCDRCFFAGDLCPAEFDGKPQATVDKIIQREYVTNTYGY